MCRDETFGLRVNDEERGLIRAVAKRLQRGESDTIRFLIRNVADELGVNARDWHSEPMEKQAA